MKTEAKASGAIAKEQTYEQTVEGKIFKKMKDYCDIATVKEIVVNDIMASGQCLGYIQHALAANNCNPDSDNTPEDIACVGRTFDDVKKFMAADLECNKKFPPVTDITDVYEPNDDPDLNRDKCYHANYAKYGAEAQARRAKWKALGYYPNN